MDRASGHSLQREGDGGHEQLADFIVLPLSANGPDVSVAYVLVSLCYTYSRMNSLIILDAARPANHTTARERVRAKLHAMAVAVLVGGATAIEQRVHRLVKVCSGHGADRNLVLAHPHLNGAVVVIIERRIISQSLMSC